MIKYRKHSRESEKLINNFINESYEYQFVKKFIKRLGDSFLKYNTKFYFAEYKCINCSFEGRIYISNSSNRCGKCDEKFKGIIND